MTDLSPRQERFCEFYAIDPNAARSARKAGYSERSARQYGFQLLHRSDVLQRIAEIKHNIAEQLSSDRDGLLIKVELVYRHSLENRRYHSALRAVELMAKLSGTYPKVHVAEEVEDTSQTEISANNFKKLSLINSVL